ncbi:hypothetical protein KFK09_009041 [Dendrobium nobile]|uniref:Uncharacterized protein n=1 Tax=Dendrobium nobile TaxID=94219 RepID=A0A8T3BPN6_DENNO|nr:hypothetical protein KFK09_009041 [Dendrobium nobile]
MRVLFCKSYFPSIRFSKSFVCIYSPCPIKLEDAQHVSNSLVPVSPVVEDNSSEVKIGVKENESGNEKADVLLKSSLKKSSGSGKEVVGKARVKWMDLVGKELAKIREFEPMFLDHHEP